MRTKERPVLRFWTSEFPLYRTEYGAMRAADNAGARIERARVAWYPNLSKFWPGDDCFIWLWAADKLPPRAHVVRIYHPEAGWITEKEEAKWYARQAKEIPRLDPDHPMFGITLIHQDISAKRKNRNYCWWVRLFWENKRPGIQRAFFDKDFALIEAKAYRDEKMAGSKTLASLIGNR